MGELLPKKSCEVKNSHRSSKETKVRKQVEWCNNRPSKVVIGFLLEGGLMFMRRRITFVLILLLCVFISCSKSTKNETSNETPEAPPVEFTPRENEEAELIALCLSGELIAPDSLYEQVLSDLAAIRATFGDTFELINQIKFMPPWQAGCLIIGFDESTFQQIRNDEYHAWDDLNQQYHASNIDTIPFHLDGGIVLLTFEGRLHPWCLTELYSVLPGARAPSPNFIAGDWSNVYARQTRDGITYLFRRGWGDCPSGCLYSEYWYFIFEGDQPVFVGHWAPDEDPNEPDWWEEARQNEEAYRRW